MCSAVCAGNSQVSVSCPATKRGNQFDQSGSDRSTVSESRGLRVSERARTNALQAPGFIASRTALASKKAWKVLRVVLSPQIASLFAGIA